MFRDVESYATLLDNMEQKVDIVSPESFIKSIAIINEKFDSKGFLLIHAAIEKQNISLIKQLLNNKADLAVKTKTTAENKEELTPLELAVKLNQPSIIDLLLQAGANPTVKNSKDHTPIEEAVILEHWDCVKQLAQSDKNTPASLGFALKCATNHNKNDCAELLLSKGATLSSAYNTKKGYFDLHVAVENNNLPLVKMLLEHKANPSLKTKMTKENSNEITPLEVCIQQKPPQPKIIALLLQAGADPSVKNAEGQTLIKQAAKLKHWDCVKQLAKSGKNTPEDLGYALSYAVDHKENGCAKLLISKGAELSHACTIKNGYYDLHVAVEHNNLSLVKMLLEHKANPSLKTDITEDNSHEITPLEIAIKQKEPQPKIIALLLEARADSSVKNSKDETLIEQAAMIKHWDCVEQLIPHCRDPIRLGRILLYAIQDKKGHYVNLLLQAKANLTSANFIKTGFSPLHEAVNNGSIDLVAKLLNAKADPLQKTNYAENKTIKTAFQMALDSGKNEIIALFEEKISHVKSLIENRLVNVSSFMEEYDNLEEVLKNYSFEKIMSTSKNCKGLTSLFTLAYLVLYLKNMSNNELAFLKDINYFFRDIPSSAHVFVANALLSILQATFENINSFNTAAKKEMRSVFKTFHSEEKCVHYNNNLFKLKLLKEHYCKKLQDEIHKDKIDVRLKIKIHKIAALEYILKALASGDYDFQNLKETSILFFGKDILDHEWFSGSFLINRHTEELIRFISTSHTSSNVSVPLFAPMSFVKELPVPSAPPAFVKSSTAEILSAPSPAFIQPEKNMDICLEPEQPSAEVTPISIYKKVEPAKEPERKPSQPKTAAMVVT